MTLKLFDIGAQVRSCSAPCLVQTLGCCTSHTHHEAA